MRTIPLYSLSELKELFPATYTKVHERWEQQVRSESPSWAGEVQESLEAVLKALDIKLLGYSLDYSGGYSSLQLSFPEDWVLTLPAIYGDPPTFPGHCPFTGYCADEDFIEAIYKNPTNIARALIKVCHQHYADDYEQQSLPESMEANWDHLWYTEDGDEVTLKVP